MESRALKITEVRQAIASFAPNDAEQLRVAHRLIEDVFSRVQPMTDLMCCIAEGYLALASHAVDQAAALVETWPYPVLPEPEDEEAAEPVCQHEACKRPESDHGTFDHQYTDR